MPAGFDGSFDCPESLPETYSSIETKLELTMLEFNNHSVPLDDPSAVSWGSNTGSKLC